MTKNAADGKTANPHFNNPAGRLLVFLQQVKGATVRQGLETAEQVLSVVLNANGSRPVMLSQFSKVLVLPLEVKIAVMRHEGVMSAAVLLKWLPTVENALSALNLAAHIDHFRNQMDAMTMYGLEICSDLLARHAPERVLSEEDISILSSELSRIKELVLKADLPLALKRFLLLHLDEVEAALRAHRLSGSVPLEQAFNAVVGAMVIDPTMARASNATPEGKSFWSFFSKLHTILQATWTTAQIAGKEDELIQKLLGG